MYERMAEEKAKWLASQGMAASQANHIGGAVGLSVPARDRGMLEVSMDGIGASLDDLQSSIERLAQQLGVILRPENPQPTNTCGNAAEPVCSHAVGYLQNLRRRVHNATERVQDLASRLDV